MNAGLSRRVRRLAGPGGRFVASVVSFAVVVTALEVSGPSVSQAAVPSATPQEGANPQRVGRVASRPDVVSAAVSARAQGSRVEVESLRTATSTTWVEASGLMTTEQSVAPVRFRDGAGAWRDIDLSLRQDPDGSVAPRGHQFGLRLGGPSARAGGVFASIGAGAGRGLEWLAPWPLPPASVSGTTARYAGVQPGVDLVLDARRSGFEQDFVLTRRPATAPVWRIPLRLKGLTATSRLDGSIAFVDANGVVQSSLAVPVMWDAVTDPVSGDPVNRARVALSVEQVGAGRATLVIAPDAAWLADPARVFPVTVDPTYAQQTVYTEFDTFVQSDYTTDQSASAELKLGSYNGGSVKARSFLNFPLSAIRGKKVMTASINLWETYSSSCTPTTFLVRSADLASTASRWSSQPATYTTWGQLQTANGYSSSCPGAKVTVPITGMVQAWSGYSSASAGVGLIAANENDSGSWKRFHSSQGSYVPNIVFTYDRAPSQATAPKVWSAVSYAAPGGSGLLYTSLLTPWVSATASDPDANQVRYFFEFHNSTTVSGTSLKASCGSVAVASGTEAGCAPVGNLPDNTQLWVRSRAGDLDTGGNVMLYGNWSGWTAVRTASGTPVAPTVACPSPYTNVSWTDATPTADVSCTVSATTSGSSYSVPGYFRLTLDGQNYGGGSAVGTEPGQVKVTPPFNGGTTSTTVTIPKTSPGLHTITAKSESPTGKLSATITYSFGWGSATMQSPLVKPRATTTSTVRITASAPPKGAGDTPTARLKWRRAGSGSNELVGWTDGPTLAVTANGSNGYKVDQTWDTTTATVDTNGTTSTGDDVTLNPRVPTLIDVQVCFTYSAVTQCTWTESKTTVLRVPHAFGNGFPTSTAGPGQVALWTGEFTTDVTDISVPGYTGDLSLSRSHSTYAGVTDAVTGIFGPGWTAQLDGADAGAAGLQVVDSSRVDGSIALVDGDGTALIYQAPGTGDVRRTGSTFIAGTWLPADEETELDASKLSVTSGGTITYTEDDGTVTTFVPVGSVPAAAAAVFKPSTIAEAGIASKTNYIYDAANANRVVRIVAPAPPNVTCIDANGNYTAAAGCRSLRLEYGTGTSDAGQVTGAYLDIYNPAKTGGAGPDSIKVATYTYDTSHRLTSVTDPRSGLTTSYTYTTGNLLATVTPPGLTPYQLNYVTVGSQQKLASVTRQRPAGDPTGGTATLASFVYNIPLSGSGLPDMSATSVARWNQAKAPAFGYAVFGPDHPAPASPGAADWPYASLQYTDAEGYTVNTANYGASDWQLTATDYNADGNVIRELDERALRLIRDGNLPAGATADQLATLTVYNADILNGASVATPAGTLVTDTYGPARYALLHNGTLAWVRTHGHTEYDQGAPNSGINPATALPYRLTTTETTAVADPGANTDITGETQARALTSYNAVGGGPDGWALSVPYTVTSDANPNGDPAETTGDLNRITVYDAEGRAIETRQPKSNGTDAGTTKTVYYTAAANTSFPTCGSKPQWAGLVCKTYPAAAPASPAGQPATQTLPSTETTGFTYLLAPTQVVETSGTVTRTTTMTYLADGRLDTTNTAVTGLTGSTPNTSKQTGYDAVTGLPTVVTAKNADDSVAGTVTTGYDGWGRVVSYQPSGEQATTTVYDAAGSVATVTDANGSTRYTYDGTDAAGHTEHRGLATRVEVTSAGITWTSTGGYDADGALTVQKLPGGISQETTLDNAGEPTGLTYRGQVTTVNPDGTTTVDPNGPWLGWSLENDAAGRVAHEFTPQGAAFTGPANGGPNDPGDANPYDRSYTYDTLGRLTQVKDRTANPGGDPTTTPCQTRSYGFDGNDNRVSKTTVDDTSNVCKTSGTGTTTTTVTRAFDTADRPTTGANGTGTYAYDALGRTSTLPASDAPNPQNGDVTLAYYDNDLARSITQAGTTTSYTLDALDRRSAETISNAQGTVRSTQRHYTDTSDNPTWTTTTENSVTSTRRYAELIGGDLSMTVTGQGDGELTLANPHGDIVTTVLLPWTPSDPATSIEGWNSYDEYGNALLKTSVVGWVDYGWLGAKQRAITGADLVLMGVRLYNPAAGLFTSIDPVDGGNVNAFTYPTDPVNSVDLDGRRCGRKCWKILKWTGVGLAVGVCIVGGFFVCAAAGIVSAAISARSDTGSFRGKSYWREFGRGAAFAVAGAGIGKLVGKARVFRGSRHSRIYKSRHARMTRLRHHRLTHERHRPWYHYKAQAEISYFGVIGSNRWYKNSRRNYGAD